jgi:coatomer protein complex subunit alpha (xenin)
MQPLFVSGGDDYKIKGWNYKTKKCIFTLKGHLDYIRTVFFHHELPWVLSASDDQTIRIWNYQSRTLLSILTGHSHYVMCAMFHQSKDLIISCSLDQTLRLWDFTVLRKKYTTAGAKTRPNEAFSGNEVEVKAVLEGHDRGVNWCSFHPTLNLIVSAADDRKVKLWKYTESRAWEHDSMYGHANNVSCVLFQDKLDVVVSNSEDKTIKVWDLNRRICIDTFRRDNDRFWILAVHPELHYIAAGSDSGLIVFNLQTERVPGVMVGNNDLFMVHKKQLIHYEIKSQKETILKPIDHTPSTTSLVYQKPYQIYYNQFNTSGINLLVLFKDKEKIYYKYIIYMMNSTNIEKAKSNVNSKFRYCLSACFVTKDKMAILKIGREVEVVDINDQGPAKPITGVPPVDILYPGPMGKIILKTEDSAILYDITNKKIVNQIDCYEVSKLKRVVWNSTYTNVALLCKKNLILLNKHFAIQSIIQEKFNVNSAAWNNDNVLIYTTTNHLKFALLNGDSGILRCLESPVYVVGASDSEVVTMDRDAKVLNITFEKEEYLFKLALQQKDPKKIKSIMENHKKLGNSIIAYLYKKNYSAIALNMVQDKRARFSLALDSGNLQVAFETGYQLKDTDCYARLGEEALRQGNHQIIEVAYQNTRSYEKLSFLYVLIGNQVKLQKMLTVAQKRGEVMSRFHNALYLGNIEERIRILAEVGLLHLAYLSAVAHNIPDLAEPLRTSLDSVSTYRLTDESEALIPAKPLISDIELSAQAKNNWPQHQLEDDDVFLAGGAPADDEPVEPPQQTFEFDLETAPITKEHEKRDLVGGTTTSAGIKKQSEDHGEWGHDDDLDIPDIDTGAGEEKPSETIQEVSSVADTNEGRDPVYEKTKNSQLAGELVACGYFDGAKALLNRQIGAVNTDVMNPIFGRIYSASNLLITGLPFTAPITHIVSTGNNRPLVMNSFQNIEVMVNKAQQLFTNGKFADVISAFREILWHIPLIVLESPARESEVHAIIRVCIDYIIGSRCEITRRGLNASTDALRGLELLAYMSMANLQPNHKILALRSAMTTHYKAENFIYAAFFSRKLVSIAESNPGSASADVVTTAKKVLNASEQKGTNSSQIVFEENWLNDPDAILKVSGKSLKIIQGAPKKCPYCKSSYSASEDKELCEVCGISKIGAECLGLKLF